MVNQVLAVGQALQVSLELAENQASVDIAAHQVNQV